MLGGYQINRHPAVSKSDQKIAIRQIFHSKVLGCTALFDDLFLGKYTRTFQMHSSIFLGKGFRYLASADFVIRANLLVEAVLP